MTPRKPLSCKRLCQQVDPEPHAQVEQRRTGLEQQVGIAGGPDREGRPVADGRASRRVPADGSGQPRRTPVAGVVRRPSGNRPAAGAVRSSGLPRLLGRHREQPDGVAGPQLRQRPLVGADDDAGHDEAAEARTVRPDDDGRVSGDHDAADRIGAVVHVRRVQARLAAVGARPLRAAARPAVRRCGRRDDRRSRWPRRTRRRPLR